MRVTNVAAAIACISLALGATAVRADTIALSLTGDASTLQLSPVPNGEQGSISLSGLGPTVVHNGDVLDITLALNAPVTIPAGTYFSFAGIDFSGDGFDGSPVSVNDDFSFTLDGVQTATSQGSTGTSDQLATEAVFFNQTVTFDGLTDTATVTALADPVTLNGAALQVGSFNNAPVVSQAPEPGTWALLLGGVGAMGVMLRRRRRVGATFAA